MAECLALNRCLGMCNGDQACSQQCQMNASAEANMRFQAILQCIDREMCRDLSGRADIDCVNERCVDELLACGFNVPPAPSGDGTCGELLRCYNGFPDG